MAPFHTCDRLHDGIHFAPKPTYSISFERIDLRIPRPPTRTPGYYPTFLLEVLVDFHDEQLAEVACSNDRHEVARPERRDSLNLNEITAHTSYPSSW